MPALVSLSIQWRGCPSYTLCFYKVSVHSVHIAVAVFSFQGVQTLVARYKWIEKRGPCCGGEPTLNRKLHIRFNWANLSNSAVSRESMVRYGMVRENTSAMLVACSHRPASHNTYQGKRNERMLSSALEDTKTAAPSVVTSCKVDSSILCACIWGEKKKGKGCCMQRY